MDSIKHPLNNIFDKIYVIHCAESKQRMTNINKQIEESGIDLDIWWTCYHPHSDIMMNGMILSNQAYRCSNGRELNLAREFYTIIKTSYLRGMEKILIFEDDFHLMKTEHLQAFCDNIPEDFDIIQFSILAELNMFSPNELSKSIENGIYFVPMNFGAWSNCGLALSRNAMKYFIDYLDKVFTAADIPIFESTNNIPIFGNIGGSGLKHYIPTAPIVYLINNNDSQVQTRSKDDSVLYKYYEQINKDLYII